MGSSRWSRKCSRRCLLDLCLREDAVAESFPSWPNASTMSETPATDRALSASEMAAQHGLASWGTRRSQGSRPRARDPGREASRTTQESGDFVIRVSVPRILRQIVRYREPRCFRRDVEMSLGTDTRISFQQAESDADPIRVGSAPRVDRRATVPTERTKLPWGRFVLDDRVSRGRPGQLYRTEPGVGQKGGTTGASADRTVAVCGSIQLPVDLEAHPRAETSTREH